MDIDITKVKGYGPWLFVKVEEPKRVSEGGIFLTDGNLYERIGYVTAKVLSVSESYEETTKSGKKKVVMHDVKGGERVVFRGHLKEANKFGEGCFIHVRDVLGVLEDGAELGLCVPYDN